MDSRRLLTFRTVAHERSFSAAARALFLTQPAVSQQVAALERELGGRLLDRGPGRAHADRGRHGRARARRRHRRPAGARRPPAGRAGRWRAAAAAARRVPERAGHAGAGGDRPAAARRAARPGSTWRRARPAELAERVADGRLHVGVGFQDAALPARPSTAGARAPSCSTSRSWSRWPRGTGSPGATGSSCAISPTTRGRPRRPTIWWRAACRAAGFEPRFVSITRDPLAIRALVVRGLAVTLVPRLLAVGARRGRGAAAGRDSPRRSVFALTPASGRPGLATAMIEALSEACSPGPAPAADAG